MVTVAVAVGPTASFLLFFFALKWSVFLSVGVNANTVALVWSVLLGSVGVNANAVVLFGSVGVNANAGVAAADRSTAAC